MISGLFLFAKLLLLENWKDILTHPFNQTLSDNKMPKKNLKSKQITLQGFK